MLLSRINAQCLHLKCDIGFILFIQAERQTKWNDEECLLNQKENRDRLLCVLIRTATYGFVTSTPPPPLLVPLHSVVVKPNRLYPRQILCSKIGRQFDTIYIIDFRFLAATEIKMANAQMLVMPLKFSILGRLWFDVYNVFGPMAIAIESGTLQQYK